MTFHRVLLVRVTAVLFCLYVVRLLWLPDAMHMKTVRIEKYENSSRKVLGPISSNSALTVYHKALPLPGSSERHVMLVIDYNRAPNTLHKLSFAACSHRCALTNKSSDADLIYINAGQLSPKVMLPSRRKKDQVWLLYSREPPTFPRFKYLTRIDLRDQINWTRSIFSDSTFPLVYGVLKQIKPPEKDYDAIYASKSYSIAWFVGHCDTQSLREVFVRRMMSRIDVHIYGECGNMTCGVRGYNMGGHKGECMEILSQNYKFYLAFENSFCENYVTEKFFNLFRGQYPADVIPVVRGGADYKRLFDPGIFVDAADFRSPEELADYLSHLASDKGRYLAMLQRKNRYIATGIQEKFECTLCRSLHVKDIPDQSYGDIYSFWKRPGRCYKPRDIEQEMPYYT